MDVISIRMRTRPILVFGKGDAGKISGCAKMTVGGLGWFMSTSL